LAAASVRGIVSGTLSHLAVDSSAKDYIVLPLSHKLPCALCSCTAISFVGGYAMAVYCCSFRYIDM
jgi:hypothetical protein